MRRPATRPQDTPVRAQGPCSGIADHGPRDLNDRHAQRQPRIDVGLRLYEFVSMPQTGLSESAKLRAGWYLHLNETFTVVQLIDSLLLSPCARIRDRYRQNGCVPLEPASSQGGRVARG